MVRANLTNRWCIENGRYKLILPHTPNVLDGVVELFDLHADPFEEHNLAAARPDLVRALTAKLERWWIDQ